MKGTGPARRRVAAAATPAEARREQWSADAGDRDVVTLVIPPHAWRERSFEVFCRLDVSNQGGHADATHGLRVLVNGALEWSRNVPTHAGGADALDYRLRRTVPVGQALRLSATAEVHRALRLGLTITAQEE